MTSAEEPSPNLSRRALGFINKLNLYDDEEPLSLAGQLFATRVYVVLFTILLTVLLLFTGLSVQTRTITVLSPSINSFDRLSVDYSSSLSCLCSQISMAHGQVLTFAPEYHQVCSSEFVGQKWISSLFNVTASNYYPLDFRLFSSSQFQIIALLCRTVEQFVSDAIQQFSSSQLVSSHALSRTTFDIQMESLVQQLQAKTISDVAYIDRLLSLSISQNRLLSALRTNFFVKVDADDKLMDIHNALYPTDFNTTNISSTPPTEISVCDCNNDFSCTFPSGFFSGFMPISSAILWPYPPPLFVVPGILAGCLPTFSILQSTLECLYDHACLNTLITLTGMLTTVAPLNATLHVSRFNRTTTLQAMYDELMIEFWHTVSSFDKYYHICAPQSCTYTKSQRFNLIYIITTVIGLIGGLSVVVQLFSLVFVQNVVGKFRPYFLLQVASEETNVSVNQNPLSQDSILFWTNH